jgi:hypothetical protein
MGPGLAVPVSLSTKGEAARTRHSSQGDSLAPQLAIERVRQQLALREVEQIAGKVAVGEI